MSDLSQLDLPPAVVTALVSALGVLLYVFAWRAVRGMSLLARIAARLVLAAVILVPFALLILLQADRLPETASRAPERPAAQAPASPRPSTRPEPEAAAPAPGKPSPAEAERKSDELQRQQAEERARQETEREAAARQEEAAARQEAERAARDSLEKARKKSAEARDAEPKPDDAKPDIGRTRGIVQPPGGSGGEQSSPTAIPPPPPVAEVKNADYEVVPVYFGTDRAVEADPKRLKYNWERGRQLSIGRALVSVPSAHKVPMVERPWVVRIPYFQYKVYEETEDPKKHFTMREVKALSKDDFLAAVRERLAASARFKDHALIFVHGYNTGFDNAVFRTAQIAYDLKFDGAPFLYSWPSGGQVASYTYDRESAGQSEPHLRQFLEMVVKETGAKSVSVIAHSMGNQPLLQVLKELKLQAPAGVSINQVISAAPDVDRDNFENIARAIQGFAKGVTLYAASNDRALLVSRRFHGGVPRAGDVPEQGPLLIPGMDTIDVSAASTDGLGINHSGYAENNALLNDIGLLIQTGERPPNLRVPILESVKTAKGEYWRYPGAPK